MKKLQSIKFILYKVSGFQEINAFLRSKDFFYEKFKIVDSKYFYLSSINHNNLNFYKLF